MANLLRRAALIAVAAGAMGSLGLMLYAGRHNQSRILMLLFAGWVLSPFAGAAVANVAARRWPALARAALQAVTLIFVLGSLAIYSKVAFGNANLKLGFVFLMVPLASWLLIAVVAATGVAAGRRSRGGHAIS